MKTSKTTGRLFDDLSTAYRQSDTASVERLAIRLYRATGQFKGLCLQQGLSAADADDLCQDLALKLIALAKGGRAGRLADPDAYVRRIALNLIRDQHRRRKRRQRLVERFAEERPEAPPTEITPVNGELDTEPEAQLATFVDSYAARARQTTRGNPTVQLWAWYWLRVRKQNAKGVAARLRVDHRAKGGQNSIHKWAQRGAALVRKLAASDDDPDRAAIMQRACQLAGGERAAA